MARWIVISRFGVPLSPPETKFSMFGAYTGCLVDPVNGANMFVTL